MKTFADAEQMLARSLPGYESRAPQQELAAEIETVFSEPDHFSAYVGREEEYPEWRRPNLTHVLGQAGCGTGKSLAYIIPAIQSGRRVMLSVTTKSLQDQIVSSDIPFLQEHLDEPFTWALLKGRSNYLCVNRLKVVTTDEVAPEITRVIWEAAQANPEGFSGTREEIQERSGVEIPFGAWSMVCSESDECSSNKCKPEDCYAAKARKDASSARLVVVNHALFFTDLAIRARGAEGMLGDYEVVVFDEAHALEEVAGNTLGGQVSEATYNNLTARARTWAKDFADDDGDSLAEPIANITYAARALFEKIEEGRLRNAQLDLIAEEIGNLYDGLDSLWVAMKNSTYEHASDYTAANTKRWRVLRMCSSQVERLAEIIAAPPNEVVRWVEKEFRKGGQTRMVIKTAPILVAPFLEKWLFSKVPTVLVSATLAVKGDMSYIAGRLGINSYRWVDVGTPFDYSQQGRLYVPVMVNDRDPFPIPDRNQIAVWEQMSTLEIHRLVTASRGRALVLFTSIKHMRATAESLRQMSGDLSYRMQGEARATNRDLVDWLKDHQSGGPGRVLLATKSFFTGIDIPGEALSLLVITKMPFPVPTEPLTQARCEAIEASGGSSFGDYTIPVMSLELQQGIGRLIRHRNDRGVAAILDPRLVNKGYGKTILRDLPPMPQVFKADAVAEFFEETEPLAV